MMKTQCGMAIVSMLFSVLVLSGCGPKQPWETAGVSEDFYTVAEDFAPRYLELDQDGAQYDQALDAVEEYLAGEKTQADALSAVQDAVEYYEEALANWETVSISETLSGQLQAVGISPAEYESFANSRPSNLQTQQIDLLSLLSYLQYAESDPDSRENLSWTLSKDQKIQDSMRGYYYYGCFNYWFPDADEKEREYLDVKVTDQLHSYIPEDPVWYSTREEAEEQVMLYLDQVEELLNLFADHVGQQQKDLYEMEQEWETLLESLVEGADEGQGAE